MDHSPAFLKVVNEARTRIKEIDINEARARLGANRHAILLDVREDKEWAAGHAAQARHLGRGVLERDIEKEFPDANAELIMYCGGGYRSALACDVAATTLADLGVKEGAEVPVALPAGAVRAFVEPPAPEA